MALAGLNVRVVPGSGDFAGRKRPPDSNRQPIVSYFQNADNRSLIIADARREIK